LLEQANRLPTPHRPIVWSRSRAHTALSKPLNLLAGRIMTIVGIAVVAWQGRVLVGERGAEGPLPGAAEFPGGKCRPGESPRDAALRECREETGLAVEAVERLGVVRHDYAHAAVELHFWRCVPVAPAGEAAPPFRWILPRDLPSLPFPPANAGIVAQLAAE